MRWIDRDSLKEWALVNDFMDLLKVFDSNCYNKFIYERTKSGDDWLQIIVINLWLLLIDKDKKIRR